MKASIDRKVRYLVTYTTSLCQIRIQVTVGGYVYVESTSPQINQWHGSDKRVIPMYSYIVAYLLTIPTCICLSVSLSAQHEYYKASFEHSNNTCTVLHGYHDDSTTHMYTPKSRATGCVFVRFVRHRGNSDVSTEYIPPKLG